MIQRKFIVSIATVFAFICILYYLLVMLPRQGKVAVEILVNPENAEIYIDNNRSSAGTVYLPTGNHTFKAEIAGWRADEITITVSESLNTIALLPEPVSDEARQQAMDDSIVREGLNGIAANARGLDIRNAYPILNKLPYSDSSGPFKIDYGFNQDNNKIPYLIISYSTPNGRREAINWLKDNETDTTTTEIIFEDFENPIKPREHMHGDE